jgi:hypothetical protein
MQDTAPPIQAHVAFLRIPGFQGRSVAEQASLKDRLEGRVRAAIEAVESADRLVLDAEEGVALVLFGDAARALRIAQSLRGEEAFLQVGLNHGPIARTGTLSNASVFGDGLAAAAAAAHFATPERILATEEFRRRLEQASPELAADLVSAGDFTDARLRQHSLYTPDPRRGATRRRRYIVRLFAGVAAILVLGIAVRTGHRVFFPPKPAVIVLAVKPRGEVFVDGVSQGRTPPLVRIPLEAGRHSIVIRNPGSPAFQTSLDLHPGEETTITHTFVTRRPASPPAEKGEAPGFWRDLRRRFGGS